MCEKGAKKNIEEFGCFFLSTCDRPAVKDGGLEKIKDLGQIFSKLQQQPAHQGG